MAPGFAGMGGRMFTFTWITGMTAAALALAICRAERREAATGGLDFDKPLRRTLAFGLSGAALGLLFFYAALGGGIVFPILYLGLAGLVLSAIPGRWLAKGSGAALVLALLAFACVVAAFQQVYGDTFFGFDDPFAGSASRRG